MKTYIPTFDNFINESKGSVNEAKEDFVSASMIKPDKDLRKGQEVKVDALEYTQSGDKDLVSIIRPDGKKAKTLKGNLSVKI